MKFEGPVAVWFVLATLPISVPVMAALFLAHVVRVKTGCLWFLILAGAGMTLAVGIVAYLDSMGNSMVGEVLNKNESVVFHPDGSWSRKMQVTLRYRSGETEPFTKVTLDVLPGRFDELRQGDLVPLVLPDPTSVFRLIRLDDETILPELWSWIGDDPFFFLFALGLILILSARFVMGLSLPMVFMVGGLMTIGAWWISDVVVPLWRQAGISTSSFDTVSANVKEIHPPYAGEGLPAWITNKLYSQYDLIVLEILPVGHSQNLLAVDVVDVGSADLQVGQSINVDYSPSTPRYVLIPNATRSFFWKNGLISTLLALLAALAVLKMGFLLREQRRSPYDKQVGARVED